MNWFIDQAAELPVFDVFFVPEMATFAVNGRLQRLKT
jgi:hypothetical protein